ncbi:SufS family cysteine desulfurase [Candidatus Woesebacteria bacterium]|nr:SufS family cysteine desulfurase [Candidatus Woesebacteria bacterium]
MTSIQDIKKQFPIFQNNPSLTYLDSSATSLKPQTVIDAVNQYYIEYSANIHRGIYTIAEKATQEYERARKSIATFINASSPEEVIFTRGTTESLNLVASSLGSEIIGKDDEIVTTIMEHHSNFVPWQEIATKAQGSLVIIPIRDDFTLAVESTGKSQISDFISSKTKLLAITYVSNTLGTINSVKDIITAAKKINPDIITIVDAAQAAPHMPIDVQDVGCDFLAFSGHKMCGPTGIGVLWGKRALLERMRPYQFGGEMIDHVTVEKTTYASPPHKFEAGTPAIAQAIGLGAAVDFLNAVGVEKIHQHEVTLAAHTITSLKKTFGDRITIYSPPAPYRSGIVTFTFGKYHAHDVAHILDEEGVAVRAGHHCTMPLHTHLGIPASVRASFYLYNIEEDVKKLVAGLKKVEAVLK